MSPLDEALMTGWHPVVTVVFYAVMVVSLLAAGYGLWAIRND